MPTRIYSLNEGLTTLQFQSVSLNPQNPTGELMGGTQDNGTWLVHRQSNTWTQTIYGDGGQSGFDVGNPEHPLQPVLRRLRRRELPRRRPDEVGDRDRADR